MTGVGIVGGGITGLIAGFELKKLGIPYTLYEAGNRVGGVIQTVQRDGFLAECGPNTILETSRYVRDLVDNLGLRDQAIYSHSSADRRYIVKDGKLAALPATPFQFLTTDVFSWSGKLRLGREIFVGRGDPDTDESIADFVLRRIGREFLDYAINPFVSGIYAGNPAALSVRHAFPKLQALEQKYGSLLRGQFFGARERKKSGEISKATAPKLSFKAGLQTLVAALEDRNQPAIRLRTPIERVNRAEGAWTLESGADAATSHQAILLCAPAHRLGAIRFKESEALAFLTEIKHPPVTTISFGFKKEDVAHPLDGFGVLIPEIERFNLLGCIFASSVLAGRAPEGHVTVTCFIGGSRSPALALKPVQEQIKFALADLKKLLGVRGAPDFIEATTYPKAIPQYNIGYGKVLARLTELEAQEPGLFFAGNYRDGISLVDSIMSGKKAAGRIAEYFNSRKVPTDLKLQPHS